MGMGFYPYQSAQYPPSLPPPSPFGGFAVGAPQGMPSDAFNWTGGVSEQAPRMGGLPCNRYHDRGHKRPEKKPGVVKKPGKNHARNVKRREKLKARKEMKKDDN